MRRWLIFLLLLGNLALTASRPLQTSIEVSDVGAFYSYGSQVTFQASIHAGAPIKDVFLFVQAKGDEVRLQQVDVTPEGEIVYKYDLTKTPLRPFAPTLYWFRVTLTNGQELTTSAYAFNYDDNRFTWQTLGDSQFQVNWYGRGLAFGQDVLNVAQEGVKSAQAIIPSDLQTPVRIFVYASTADLQKALQLSGQSWVAGHASPELGTIVISIPPGPDEKFELERQIPHELAHLLQYQLAGDAYNNIPNWFLEGTASLAELYPNVDYQRVLTNAASTDTLIPLNQLCGPFPREASAAFLAYAESTSFARFLHQKYGTSGLSTLLRQYQDGVGCIEGPARALGVPLNQLDFRWRQESLGINMGGLIFSNLSPYLALLGLLLVIPLLVSLPALLRLKSQRS